MKMQKKHFIFAGKVLLALLFLIYLFHKGDLDFRRVAVAFQSYGWVALAFLLMALAIIISIFRWQLLLRSQGIDPGFFKTLKLSFIGFFFNIFMPGSVGGDFIKAYYIAKQQEKKKTAAVTSVFLDRVIGLFSLVFLAALAILVRFDFFWQRQDFKILILSLFALIFLLGGGGILFLFSWISVPKFIKKRLDENSPHFFLRIFSQVYQALALYKKRPRYIFYAVGLSLTAHCVVVISCYFFGRALGQGELHFLSYFALIPIGMVIQAVPISFGSWGVGEFIFQYIFDLVTTTKSQGANICFLWHLNTTCWSLLGIIFYLEEKAEVDRLIKKEVPMENPEN